MNNSSRYPRLAQFIFWLVMMMMTALFLVPQEFVSGGIFDWWDKVQHAVVFGTLMLLGYFAYPKYFWSMAISLILYGAVIEIIQSWTGWRQGEVLDAVADAVGVLLMCLLIKAYQSNWAGRSN